MSRHTIIASSVIRSANRGHSHGGLYVVDIDNKTSKCVLDWDYPHIRWDSGGGDRGLRGLSFYRDRLYASGATHLFVFDKSFSLIDKFACPTLDGTHEQTIVENLLYTISNSYDSILVFDLDAKKFIRGYQHVLGSKVVEFDPYDTSICRSDTMHLDSVSIRGDSLYYAGSTTKCLYELNLNTLTQFEIPLAHQNTHNAQFWRNGIIFNRSIESQTCYQQNEKLVMTWPTPRPRLDKLTGVLFNDHSRVGYTRGMVLYDDMVCVGTSPGSVHVFTLDNKEPLYSCWLTNDIRNSVCGMSHFPW